MSNNSAADLLSILRGDKPAPAPPHPPPPQGTHSASSTYHTPLQSSAASMVNVGAGPNTQGSSGVAGTDGNDGLEQLFRAFGQPHPSQAAQAGQAAQQASMPGALPAQQYTPQHPPPPTLRKTSSSGADTASLLSLLRGGGAGSGGGAAGTTSGGAGGPAATATAPPPLPAQAPPPMSTQGGTAGELLASLMGGGGAVSHGGAEGGAGAASAAQPVQPAKEAVKPKEEEEKKKPQPNFNFVSPFHLLDKLHAEDKAKAASSAAASTASSAQATPQKPPLSSVPSHLLRSPRSPASTSSGGGGSDGEDRPRSASSSSRAPFASIEQVAALSASSPAPSSVGSSAAPRLSTSSAFPTHLLASQYLPSTATSTASSSSPLRASFAPPSTSSSTSRPSYAPSGLRLPRPPLTQPQTLRISLSDPHLDSLSPHAGASTPITLMDSKGDYAEGVGAGAKRKMGVWEGGIVYSMGKKGRVRVIERESGGRGLLKLNEKEKEGKKSKGVGKEKEDEIVDLRIAPAVKKDEEGKEWRHVGVVSRDGRVVVWAVSERFGGEGDEEREMQSSRILDLPADPSPGAARPSLIRFHPLYPAKPVIAIVFRGGQGGLLNVDKAQLLKRVGDTGKEVVEGAMEKIAVEGGESIIDLAFSPDGSAFAFITSTSTYSVRSTSSPLTVLFSGPIALPPSASPSFVNGGSSSGSSSTVTPAPAVLPTAADETKPPRPCEVLFVSPRSAPSRPAALAVSFTRGTKVVVFPLSSSTPLPAGAVTSLSFPPPSSNPETEKTHYGHLAYHSETQSLVVSSSLRGSLWTFRLAFPPSTASSGSEEGDDAAYLSALASSSATNEPKPIRIDHVLETPLLSGPVFSFALSPSSSSSSSASSSLPLDTPELPPAAVSAAGKTPFDVLLTHLKGLDLVQVVAEKPREYGSSSRSTSGAVQPSAAAAFTFGNANPFGLGETALEEALNGHAHDLDLHPHDHEHDDHDHLGTDEDTDEFDRAMAAGRRMSLEGSIYVSSEVEVCVEEPDHWEREHAEEAAQWGGEGMNGFDHHHHPEDRQLSVDEPALGDLGAAGLPVTPNVEIAPPHPHLPPASSVATAATPSSPSRSPSSSLHPPACTPPKSPKRAAAAGAGGLPLHHQQQEAEVIRELRRIEQGFRGEIGKIVRGELEKHVHHLEEDRLQALETTTAREETLLKLALQAVKKDTTKLVENAVREQVQKHVGPVVKEAVREEVVRGVEGAVRQVLPAELDKQLSRPDIAFPLSASIATTIAPPLERSLTNALMSAVVPAFESNLSSAVDGLVTSIRQEMLDVRKEIVQEQSGAVAVLEDEVSALKSEVAGLRAQMEQMLELLVASRLAPPEGSPRMGHHPQLQEHHHHHQQQAQAQRRAPPSAVLSPSAAVVATGANALPTAPHHHGLPASISSTSLASVTSGVASGQPLPPIPRSHTPPERYEELFTETMQPQHEPEFTALVHLINSSPAGRIDAVFPPVGGPRISMAVVLSLAFRLSQVLASRDGKMDEEGRRMLGWLRRAVTACDGKQPPEFHTMIPRILTTVLEHLVARGRRLAMIGDSAGVNEIKVIEQYARARLSLFSQGGGEGPEGFRR